MTPFVNFLSRAWPFSIEAALLLAALIIGLIRPDFGSAAFTRIERLASILARKRNLAVMAVIVLALLGRGVLLAVDPIPAPSVHDEFSYLLMGDTFALGRLTNPTHPFWKHFESFHINQVPTYCSKYPAAQGLVLALGEVLFGHPWFGVWISVGLMCGAICWMLQGWLPPGWALLGGVLAIVRLGLFSYWVDSYWGGAVATIGGCLALGALGRMRYRIRPADGFRMGAGAAILAHSRPYEGMLVCIGIGVFLLIWTFRRGPSAWRALLAATPAMLIPIACAAAFMYIYFRATTGNPFVSPYQVYNRAYAVMPLPNFPWSPLMPAHPYNHPAIEAYYRDWEAPNFLAGKSAVGFLKGHILMRIRQTLAFFFGPALALSLLCSWRIFADRRVRPLLWIALLLAAGQSLQPFLNMHYAAPVTGAIIALILQGLRHLRFWRPAQRPVGLFLVRSAIAICFVMVAVRIVHPPHAYEWNRERVEIWCCASTGNLAREAILKRFESMGGSHLVFVHYAPGHNPHAEWVYNAADIDNAPVVFAREMDPASDRALAQYFHDRTIWLLQADASDTPVSRWNPPQDGQAR